MSVALVVQDNHPAEVRTEEGQEAGSIGFAQEDQEVADTDWAADQQEKGAGPVAARGEVDSLDSVARSLGPRTDY